MAVQYIKLNFKLNDIIIGNDSVIVEKIVVSKNTDVARGLLNNQQPMYYMSDDIYFSSVLYMGGIPEKLGDDPYELEFIDATSNIKNGATVLYDFSIPEINTKLYAYRIHVTKDTGTYVTDFAIATYADLADLNLTEGYGAAYIKSPNMVVRNFAFRGRNSLLKYNMSMREYASDSKSLWDITGIIDTELETVTTQAVALLDSTRKLYALQDKLQFIARNS